MEFHKPPLLTILAEYYSNHRTPPSIIILPPFRPFSYSRNCARCKRTAASDVGLLLAGSGISWDILEESSPGQLGAETKPLGGTDTARVSVLSSQRKRAWISPQASNLLLRPACQMACRRTRRCDHFAPGSPGEPAIDQGQQPSAAPRPDQLLVRAFVVWCGGLLRSTIVSVSKQRAANNHTVHLHSPHGTPQPVEEVTGLSLVNRRSHRPPWAVR